MTDSEMIGWDRQVNGHEFEQDLGVGDGQVGPACCSPWGCKELDMAEQLDWTELSFLELQGLNTDFDLCTTSYQMALFVSSFLCMQNGHYQASYGSFVMMTRINSQHLALSLDKVASSGL